MAGCSSPYDRDDHTDPDPPPPCKDWAQAVWEVVWAAEHPLECARSRDDYDCTCGMAERLMEGHCEECGHVLFPGKFPYQFTCPYCAGVA
jgi:hypothetical protein